MGSSKEKSKGGASKSKPVARKPTANAAPSAKPAKRHTRSAQRERLDDPLASDDDDEQQVVANGDAEHEDAAMEVVSDDEDNVKEKKKRSSKPDTRTPEEKAANEKVKSKRRNAKARRRGYRVIAKRAGYSIDPNWACVDGSVDVAVPVTTPNEAIRACKWAPAVTDKPAFGGYIEFEERTGLSHESLPKSAARVLQANGEQYLRRLTAQTVQMSMDQLKTRATAATVAAVTRPLKRVQKYTFVAPTGIVRYAQSTAKGVRLPYLDGESKDLEKEEELHKIQKAGAKALAEKAEALKEGKMADYEDAKKKVATQYKEAMKKGLLV